MTFLSRLWAKLHPSRCDQEGPARDADDPRLADQDVVPEVVEIELGDGRTVRHHAKAVRGTPDNPMTTQEIEDKARDLIAPIIGAERAGKLVDVVRSMETMRSVHELRPLLQA